jgi:hypothetical protein
MTKDCLICLCPTIELWNPALLCDCRLFVHRACWDTWSTFSGSTCLICRVPPPPLRQDQAIYVYHQYQLLGLQRILYTLTVLIVLVIFAAIRFHGSRR